MDQRFNASRNQSDVGLPQRSFLFDQPKPLNSQRVRSVWRTSVIRILGSNHLQKDPTSDFISLLGLEPPHSNFNRIPNASKCQGSSHGLFLRPSRSKTEARQGRVRNTVTRCWKWQIVLTVATRSISPSSSSASGDSQFGQARTHSLRIIVIGPGQWPIPPAR